MNLRKGGTLTILNDCLRELSQLVHSEDWRVVALVHDRRLADYPGIEYIEIPWSVRSWAHRLWCEYVTMYGISKRIGDIDLWLSLHDTTPRVRARHQAVYCHNSYPFFRWKWHHLWQNYRIVCFALFTRWFYRINLHRNDFVIVQSDWFRDAFRQMFGVKNVVVFPPNSILHYPLSIVNCQLSIVNFLYPAYPDVHKNMECLCEAARLLEHEVGTSRFEVLLTTDTNFNRYSRWLHQKWGDVKSIRFCGFLSKDELNNLYSTVGCLVFPSQVETWGLPISEFAATGRPMLLADMPYAHETAAGSSQTAFFNTDKPEELAKLMLQLINGDYSCLKTIPNHIHQQPVAYNWREIIKLATNMNTEINTDTI